MQTTHLLYGGTFDPVHLGHVAIFNHARTVKQFDHCSVLPCFQPVHKAASHTSADDRIAMLTLAFNDATIDTREVRSQAPRYTIETLKSFDAKEKLYFLIGADSLLGLTTWFDWQGILDCATLLVASRPHYDVSSAPIEVHTAIAQGKIELLPPIECPMASSQIRCLPYDQMKTQLPAAVFDYIRDKKLYE